VRKPLDDLHDLPFQLGSEQVEIPFQDFEFILNLGL
jgi:hypothetical protein